MVYIALPEDTRYNLSFYLAMEEFVAKNIDKADCFFMWQVEPSVIFGRNQLIETEVNMEYCREHGIRTYRRKSGGGCVYADMSNVMFSYITKDQAVNFTFNKYVSMVVMMLQRLGVDAKASGRNDILIGERKVSGNAFYHAYGRSIVHGTMLYDTNMENMVGSITPSDVKLVSKGIQSVRQRIALLKDYVSISLEEFKNFVREELCDEEYRLTEEDVEEIQQIERGYLSPEFIYGNNPRYSIIRRGYVENVGNFEIRLAMKNNIIKSLVMLGDFFIVGDVDSGIISSLRNVALTEPELKKALPENLGRYILNLCKQDLIHILLRNDEDHSTE